MRALVYRNTAGQGGGGVVRGRGVSVYQAAEPTTWSRARHLTRNSRRKSTIGATNGVDDAKL